MEKAEEEEISGSGLSLAPCMSKSMSKRKAVPKAASENGPLSSSQEAAFGSITLALGERSSLTATRAHDRLAAGCAAEQTDRFAPRGSTSPPSPDRCFVPGLSRTAARAASSHYKKEKTMPATAEPHYVGLDIAKDQLDYCLTDTEEGRVANTAADRANPILAAFYQRLRANGKPAKVCFVAVMRKLVCMMNRLIQDPNFALAN
jgi:hypothetical protein